MSQTHFKTDSCFLNQTNQSNKSIIDYTINNSPFINANECVDYSPVSFINYIPKGVPQINIDIENELRGSMRLNTKCQDCKYSPQDKKMNLPPNKKECTSEFKILPNGYYQTN